MSGPSRPLAFLGIVVGVWTVGRVIALAPSWAVAPADASQPPPSGTPPTVAPIPLAQAEPPAGRRWTGTFDLVQDPPRPLVLRSLSPPAPLRRFRAGDALPIPLWSPRRSSTEPPRPSPLAPASAAPPHPALLPQPNPPLRASRGRLAGSAWLLVREDVSGTALAPGGTLGGSQAGLRVTYRFNDDARRPLAVSARTYVPLARPQGAEVAVGVDWRPVPALPVHILAERREALGREGRSDFSLTVYGGVDRTLARGRVRVQAYGQAGVVGTRDCDLFADGAARATTRLGPVEIGGGIWGGAQPGAERLDIGPSASARIPVGRAAVSVSADWRFRIAGGASPGSGPALTIATDF